MRAILGIAVGAALCLAFATPAGAGDAAGRDLGSVVDKLVDKMAKSAPAEPGLKGDIDTLLNALATRSQGLVKWEGADQIATSREGEAEIVDLTNAHLALGPNEPHPAHVTLDHIAVRRAPGPDNSVALAIALPLEAIVRAADGGETKLALKDAKARIVLDAASNRALESTLAIAGARIEDQKSGDWISFGPLSFASKLGPGADAGWAATIDFSLQQVGFFFREGPTSGAIERIAYGAQTAGPDHAALNRLRDRLDALNRNDDIPADERFQELVDLLPKLFSMFSLAKGELTVDGVSVKGPNDEMVFALKSASTGGAATGLSGDTAALRITLKHDGLALAAKFVDPGKTPRRAALDFGLEDIGTAPLWAIIEAAGKSREGADDAATQQASQQLMAAAATLNPLFRIYELTIDAPDIGIEATAKAQGSPLMLAKYAAEADIAVRGFDALVGLVGDGASAAYLALLKEIGAPGAAADGTPRLKFHLASTFAKWLTVNGSDLGVWLAGGDAPPGQPRALRPAAPAMTGEDVRAVQQALAAARLAAPQNGSYDAATAVAVARFQKQNGLNVDGVADSATRQKLGIKPEPPPPGPPPLGPRRPPN